MYDGIVASRTPALLPLPLGLVRPGGWLAHQLRIQAEGLSGHLDEIWPDVGRSKWIGGDAEGWERAPYWLDGFLPLAILLDDERLLSKARYWIDYILAHQQPEGWFGEHDTGNQPGTTVPRARDPWPQFILLKAFAQWYEATQDARLLPAMLRSVQSIADLLAVSPLTSWAKMRWPDLAWVMHWLYARTDEAWLPALLQTIQRQGYDWQAHFADFAYTGKQEKWLLENHVVNHAMALKEPAVRPDGGTVAEAWATIRTLDRYHGQPTGMFSGDESLAGRSPSQGTELCAVVEYLFSLEVLLAQFGAASLADRWERIAFNALPATFSKDMWAHQYVQQVNQVVCRRAPDGERLYTNNGPDANLFGLEPNFGCCTANMHQGWPKFAAHVWMATPDRGLAALSYAPCTVSATVADGKPVTLTVETEYPFRETVRITMRMDEPVMFPLHLRIPEWATGATVNIGDEEPVSASPGGWFVCTREWQDGETLTVHLPMPVRLESGAFQTVSVLRGPLLFGLRIGEAFQTVGGTPPYHDREVLPTTPWNYALVSTDPTDFLVTEAPLPDSAFASEAPAVVLTTSGRQIPDWEIVQNAAAVPPEQILTTGDTEQITLVPYGTTCLRVAAFPLCPQG